MDLREIDRLIAEKVMGWRLKSFAGAAGGFTAWVNDAGKIVKYENDCTLHVHQYDFWRPTINIADAWQAAEKFYYKISTDVSDNVTVELMFKEGEDTEIYSYKTKSVTLAICLAALKAHGIDVEI